MVGVMGNEREEREAIAEETRETGAPLSSAAARRAGLTGLVR